MIEIVDEGCSKVTKIDFMRTKMIKVSLEMIELAAQSSGSTLNICLLSKQIFQGNIRGNTGS